MAGQAPRTQAGDQVGFGGIAAVNPLQFNADRERFIVETATNERDITEVQPRQVNRDTQPLKTGLQMSGSDALVNEDNTYTIQKVYPRLN